MQYIPNVNGVNDALKIHTVIDVFLLQNKNYGNIAQQAEKEVDELK